MTNFTAFFLGILLGMVFGILLVVSYAEGKENERQKHKPHYPPAPELRHVYGGYQPQCNASPESTVEKTYPANPPSTGSSATDN